MFRITQNYHQRSSQARLATWMREINCDFLNKHFVNSFFPFGSFFLLRKIHSTFWCDFYWKHTKWGPIKWRDIQNVYFIVALHGFGHTLLNCRHRQSRCSVYPDPERNGHFTRAKPFFETFLLSFWRILLHILIIRPSPSLPRHLPDSLPSFVRSFISPYTFLRLCVVIIIMYSVRCILCTKMIVLFVALAASSSSFVFSFFFFVVRSFVRLSFPKMSN